MGSGIPLPPHGGLIDLGDLRRHIKQNQSELEKQLYEQVEAMRLNIGLVQLGMKALMTAHGVTEFEVTQDMAEAVADLSFGMHPHATDPSVFVFEMESIPEKGDMA